MGYVHGVLRSFHRFSCSQRPESTFYAFTAPFILLFYTVFTPFLAVLRPFYTVLRQFYEKDLKTVQEIIKLSGK